MNTTTRNERLATATVSDPRWAAVAARDRHADGRFCDAVLGMTPTNYRARGAHTQIRFAIGECSLGAILVATSERGVCAITHRR